MGGYTTTAIGQNMSRRPLPFPFNPADLGTGLSWHIICLQAHSSTT